MTARTSGYRRCPMLAGAALALLLAGCGEVPGLDTVTGLFSSDKDDDAGPAADTDGNASSGPVKFTLGDRYTFDNPVERWEVVAIRGERVYWRSDLGERQITGFNPLLPAQEWFGRNRGKGRRLIRDKEGSLFPLRVGARLQYRSTVTTDRPPFGWEHNWTCEVTGKETVKTLGGPFETFVVECGHERPGLVTYHYAPKVGNYLVRRVKHLDGRLDSVRSLLSFERADGTVVAGIVPDRAANRSKEATKAATAAPSKPGPEAALKPPAAAKPAPAPAPERKAMVAKAPPTKPVPQKPSPSKPSPPTASESRTDGTERPVNPPADAAAEVTVSDAIASLTLAEPNFGGRATPPPPSRKPPSKAGDAKSPPAARPAPVPPVTRKPVPPPAPKPVARSPAPKKAAPVRRAGRAPAPSALGPRAAASGGSFAPRARVPVPPPPVAVKPAASAPKEPRVPPPPVAVKSAPSVPKPPAIPPAVPAPPQTASSNAIHLASYRSEGAAKQGWAALKTKNGDLLNGLAPQIRRIAVEGKGTYFRLYAGPVAPTSAASLCRKLNGRGVFCAPAS